MWNSRLYVRLQPKETTMFEEERKINLCYKVLTVTVIYLPIKDLYVKLYFTLIKLSDSIMPTKFAY